MNQDNKGEEKIMTKVSLRPFAPNGLLSEAQTKLLMAWFQGEGRQINQRGIAKEIGVSRNKLYTSFDKNPERPFDELPLKAVNLLIELYNSDIQKAKEEKKKSDEETKKKNEKRKKMKKKMSRRLMKKQKRQRRKQNK